MRSAAGKTSVPNAAHALLRLSMSVMLVSAVLGAGTLAAMLVSVHPWTGFVAIPAMCLFFVGVLMLADTL